MDSRRVYRELEEIVDSGRYDHARYPHSFVSRSIRYDFREAREFRSVLGFKMTALSALFSHGKLSVDSGLEVNKEIFSYLLRTIPYLKTSEATKEKEREKAVELFNEVSGKMEELAKKMSELSGGKVDI